MFANICAFCVAFLISFAPPLEAAGTAPSAIGDWTGTLNTPQGGMRLWLTIKKGEDGSLGAVLESVDQAPGQKIPVGTVASKDDTLTFTIPAIGARYEGRWNSDEKHWQGTFSQGMQFSLAFKAGKPASKPFVEGLDGIWRAIVNRNGKDIRLVIKVKTDDSGTLVTFDALDAPAYNIPVAGFARKGREIGFGIPAASVQYQGTIAEDGTSFSGNWQEPGQDPIELTFKRDIKKVAQTFKRPQNPKNPLPYKVEEVAIDNADTPSVTLSGTLTLPEGSGPFPAAILISGSGASDRDESFMGHKPFLVLSDHLTRAGIAVLRYDDRGTAKSTGNYSAADSRDFAQDANAAFRFLAKRADIKKSAIGFIGHSEGGLIAPIALQDNNDAAFMIMLAGPGTNTQQLVLSQARLVSLAAGRSEGEIEKSLAVSKSIIETVAGTQDTNALNTALDAVLSDEALAVLGVSAAQRDAVKGQFITPWYRYFVTYDPANFLPQIQIPVLAIGGSLDLQVPSAENLEGIKKLMVGNADLTVREFEGLNHLFQPAKTGAMGEYRDIETTFDPAALKTVSSWINARF